MTGYEFTHYYQPNFSARVKAEGYPFHAVYTKIMLKVPDIQSSASYADAKEWIIDVTMSCDKQEALAWMNTYMVNAIAYGIETKDLDWQNKFVAAFDIMTELLGGGSDRGNYSGSQPWNAPGMSASDFIR